MAPKRMATNTEAAPIDYAAQWDQPEWEELTLPSGKKVRVQAPDMAIMAREGLIPNHLLPIVERFAIQGALRTIGEVNPEILEDAAPGAALVKAAELNAYIDFFCIAATLNPRLSLDGDEGTIKVTKLTKNDRFAIWDWGVGLTASIARFSELQAGPAATLEPSPDGGAVRDTTERPAESDAA